MASTRQAIIIDPKDNVATAIRDLQAGSLIQTERGAVLLVRDIPFGHKFALSDIPQDGYILKYGAQIGRATAFIAAGDYVHVHNVEDITDEIRKGA